jgi:ubiquinone/menaquinone biosynthesis C-methylase UbiE
MTDEDLLSVATYDYWNDVEIEKEKAWWVDGDDGNRLWSYLRSTRLYEDYLVAENIISTLPSNGLLVGDLAVGIGWTSSLISRITNVAEVNAFEISRHRIETLFESSVNIFGAQSQKINRFIGSFYETGLPDEYLDVVFMSQAFHHAENPFILLKEIFRILKSDGIVLIVGEPSISYMDYFRKIFIELIKRQKIVTNFYELFKPNTITGDRYYRRSDYFFLASALGFRCSSMKLPSGDLMYVLRR